MNRLSIHRGEIHYVKKSPSALAVGSEMYAGRPAIVVSNEMNNRMSEVVEVVYLTSQPKVDLPTHVKVQSSGRSSFALCEQVHSVSKSRLNGKLGVCSKSEMRQIDEALCVSLALTPYIAEKTRERRTRYDYERR